MTVPKARIPPAEILLVEDNPVDVMLIEQALNDAKISGNLHVVEDGEEAMEFLLKQGKFATAPSPELIVLDLNLPRKDGWEVLAETKEAASLRHIPVIILTSSESQDDIWKSYELRANCFVTKPIDSEEFTKTVECIREFWLSVVQLPPSPKP